jgi:hypothetical protein
LFRDADDAVHDLDGKDLRGGRVRVELAKDPRDRNRGRFGDRDDRDRGRRGNPPGPRTKYRIIVENVSSRTSWQVITSFSYYNSKVKNPLYQNEVLFVLHLAQEILYSTRERMLKPLKI